MYDFFFTKNFERNYKKLTNHNQNLKKEIKQTINFLKNDPYHPTLRTHKVSTVLWGVKRSSRVNGDIRIIWDFSATSISVINIITLGGHSGKSRVY